LVADVDGVLQIKCAATAADRRHVIYRDRQPSASSARDRRSRDDAKAVVQEEHHLRVNRPPVAVREDY
jgi:hypothetical protein